LIKILAMCTGLILYFSNIFRPKSSASSLLFLLKEQDNSNKLFMYFS
jgi:hypothetical protein